MLLAGNARGRDDVGKAPGSAAGGRWRRWGGRTLEYGPLILALAATQVLSKGIWDLPNGDVDLYQNYAVAFWLHRPRLHALPVEYPPLALAVFMLTLVPPLPWYHITFAAWTGLFVLLGYRGIRDRLGRTRGYIYVLYLAIGALATILARFDIVPALATLAALWAVERGRFGTAYALIAAGILLKLYPAFLLPVVAVAHWRALAARDIATQGEPAAPARNPIAALARFVRRPATRRTARGLALCAALVLAGYLPALVVNTAGALSGFNYAGDRPLQIESTPAAILWLGTIVGIPAQPDYSFTSLNYVGVLDIYLKPLSAVALAAGCLWVYWRQACGRLRAGQAFVACLAVVLVTNKIFSPQYLIWALPIVAYVEGFDLVWIAICLLTLYEFPIIYQMRRPILTVPYSWEFMPVLALRNGLLLYATLRAIMRPPRRAPEPSGAGSANSRAAPIAARPSPPDERGESAPALAGQDVCS